MYLELQEITKSFVHGGVRNTVLDEVSLDVGRGEFCAIVGPSGCGKSSILRIVAGLIKPDAGRVVVDGQEVERPSEDVGLVFQQFNLLPWKTVRNNVLFGLGNLGLSKSERSERARHWLSA